MDKLGKSNFTEISGSDEFVGQRSSSSAMESSSTCEETNEEVEEVGTRISYDRIPEMEAPSSSTSSAESIEAEPTDSTSRLMTVDQSTNAAESDGEKGSQRCVSHERSVAPTYKERMISRTREAESLEGWDRVVGQTANSMGAPAKRERSYRRDSVPQENTSGSQAEKSSIPEASTIVGTSMRVIDTSTGKKNRENKNARAILDTDSLSGTMKMEKNDKHISKKVSGLKTSPKNPNAKKTPTEILENYAAQNDKRVEYKALQGKTNSLWEIECSFAGYVAKRIGSSEIAAKNEVATIILRMLAEKQMDEQDMKNLIYFSDGQMRDIIALGTEGKPENAMRKLYKFCLEKNAPKPVYTVKGSNEVEGFKHFAECRAMGEVGQGSAIRDESAKISAAEELYTKLRSP